jgi:amidohydrolase
MVYGVTFMKSWPNLFSRLGLVLFAVIARADDLDSRMVNAARAVTPQVIAWRRDIHRHPELSNREQRTAALVAKHLRELGLEVHTGIAHTGVVALLKGGKPGPTVALRADMDALPVTEPAGLAFASSVTTTYNNQQVGVMHACGHDAHTAMLMGAASVLTAMRNEIHGTIAFIFQPAEEGAPEGEEGGAELMVREGVLQRLGNPEAIFAVHVWPRKAGEIHYRAGGIMAASDVLKIVVHGKQTHGAQPWSGVDPIIVSAQIMLALQTIPSRQLDITRAPALITIGSIHGGVRSNIIPDRVEMLGTLRNLDDEVRAEMHARVKRTAESIAAAAGATAEVDISERGLLTFNDPPLTARMLPALRNAANGAVVESQPVMGAEDFSFFQREIPGLYVFLGVNKEGVTPEQAAPNHSPLFFVNEDALETGVRVLTTLAVDYPAGR